MGRPTIDLVGQKFGMLTVLSLSDKKSKPKIRRGKEYCYPLWRCKCDCGNEVEVEASYLKQVTYGRITPSCGCHKFSENNVGKEYTHVKIIDQYYSEDGKKIWYKCLCECGNQFDICKYDLDSDPNRSCGCLKQRKRNVRKDLSGKKFGRLSVIKRDPTPHITKGGNTCVYWICDCDCGRRVSIPYSSLMRKDPSCGCKMAERQNITIGEYEERYKSLRDNEGKAKDLSGKVFGLLTAIESVEIDTKANRIRWRCRCECGNYVNITTSNLLNGHTQSCGCINSVGEAKIRRELDSIGVNYQRQYRFDGCKDVRSLPFDFVINDNIGNNVGAIEFDGLQHFKPVRFNGMTDEKAASAYTDCVRHDKIKTEFCKKNNIPLLRITYKQVDDIPKLLGNFINGLGGEICA